MEKISTLEQVSELAVSGFSDWKKYGAVGVRGSGDLLVFNYTKQAQAQGNWHYFEAISRGLIINRITGEIVARAFDKFYNWTAEDTHTYADIAHITEKLDGSLGVMYRQDGIYKIATRGSIDSDQAIWATDFLQRYNLSDLPNEYTLIFEVIYPKNRIIVNYENREDLVLLAIRNRFTGEFISFDTVQAVARQYGFSLPKTYTFDSITDLISTLHTLSENEEGYVVEFKDGQRFKFKSKQYLDIHRKVSFLSFKNTLLAVTNDKVDELLESIPDEFLTEFKTWLAEIENKVTEIKTLASKAYEEAPKEDRKIFSTWAVKNHKALSLYLFALWDNKPLEPLVYKHEFKNR